MKVWPVPDSYSRELPKRGTLGSFWENRGDRYHCGVDIFAPVGSDVISVQNGKVIDVGRFTSPSDANYLNESFYIIIKTPQNLNIKYAEVDTVLVRIGDFVNAGQKIASISKVLNEEQLSHSTPHYLREMMGKGLVSMLHLEAYISPISEVKPYLYGNFMGEEKPYSIVDPALFLNGTAHHSEEL
jgi:murein DD-endopeptidase MepM/ murein hydrolase activator NlpD